jgi:ectoine hydroxylase-related dioxygenase (phytanoyl-CoA dioxygenase family)
MVVVSEADVEFYQRNGAVVIRNLLNAEEVEKLATAIDWNIENPSPLGQTASRNSDPGRFFEDFCNWQRISAYREIIFESALPEVASKLMRSAVVRLYHDHMLTKEPATKQPTPWHQDLPYYNIEGSQNISFWIPVDPVSRPATLEFVARSNDGTWYMPKTFLTDQSKWFPEGSLAEVPDIDGESDSHEILGWELNQGDAVAFHMLTLHGARGSTNRRRAFSVRVMGEDIRHAPRTWRTSPEFEGLAEELAAGAEMNHPLFPIIHPR